MNPSEHLRNVDRSANLEISKVKLQEALDSILPKQKEYIIEAIPAKQQRTLADAFVGKGLSKAVKAKCFTCCNFDMEEVKYCAVVTCPLHSVRPFRKKSKDDAEDEDQDE